ncbi:DMT family transporter [Kordiimonas marina]|uniref:DMT family transporter n=1 Tax=Kordiimonas marina TaxID=2872312 RepID=UPI001FF55201|nr:EamA family transporter [Kordiimonas marina]MCJ9429562.1 DMT family transporter [Kordiimonas marina]
MGVVFAFLGCVLIWGSTWYAIELQLGVVPKEWSLAFRFGIASIILFAWCLARGKRLRFSARDHGWMLTTGFFLFSANYLMIYWGTEYLTSGLVAVAFSTLSFMNIVNGRIFLKAPVQPSVLLSALIGVIGLMLIFKPEISHFSLADDSVRGLVFCLIGTLLASWGNTLVGTKSVKSIPLLPFNAWGMLYGALFDIVFAAFSGKAPVLDPRPEYWGSLLYLSILGTVVAFSLYLWLLGQVGVGRAAYMAVMTPVVALTVSTFMEGFHWTTPAITGLALVIVGNVVMINRKTTVSPAPAKAEEAA